MCVLAPTLCQALWEVMGRKETQSQLWRKPSLLGVKDLSTGHYNAAWQIHALVGRHVQDASGKDMHTGLGCLLHFLRVPLTLPSRSPTEFFLPSITFLISKSPSLFWLFFCHSCSLKMSRNQPEMCSWTRSDSNNLSKEPVYEDPVSQGQVLCKIQGDKWPSW